MKTAVLTLTAVMAVLVVPSSASAATCADYTNQADAQRAADTRDADGDGIYCESLPCPCAGPGTPRQPRPTPATSPVPEPIPTAPALAVCSPTTRPVLAIKGLSTRRPYGVSDVFSVSIVDRTGDASAIRVQMLDEADRKPFFTGTVNLDEPLFVQLDLDETPALVVADYIEQRDTAQCLRRIQRRTTGYRRMLLPARCRAGSYRPKMVILACGSGGYDLERLRWKRWNTNVATARGRARINDCIPFCAEGTIRRYAVSVQASRPRFCAGDFGMRYTRVRITYPGRRLKGVPRRSTRSFACNTSLDAPSP